MDIQAKAEELAKAGYFTGGPVQDFERIGRSQFIVLSKNGLRPNSKVLDFGCSMLRAGYWLINFLDFPCYFGIKPRTEALNKSIRVFLGDKLLAASRLSIKHSFEWIQHECKSKGPQVRELDYEIVDDQIWVLVK